MPTIADYLEECYREEFVRAVDAWRLRDVRKHIEDRYAWYEVDHAAVTLRLLSEHGCISCEIRPSGEDGFIYVPEFMRLADHIGKKAQSFEPERRRYSLREQCEMLIERQEEAIATASAALAGERHMLLKKFGAAYMAQFEKKGQQGARANAGTCHASCFGMWFRNETTECES